MSALADSVLILGPDEYISLNGCCCGMRDLRDVCSEAKITMANYLRFKGTYYDDKGKVIVRHDLKNRIQIPLAVKKCEYYFMADVVLHNGHEVVDLSYSSVAGYSVFESSAFASAEVTAADYFLALRDGTAVSSSNFTIAGCPRDLYLHCKRSCYSSVDFRMVRKRADLHNSIGLKKRKAGVDCSFDNIANGNNRGLDNVDYYTDSCIEKFSKLPCWLSEIELLVHIYQRIFDNLELDKSYNEMPRRMLVDPLIYTVMEFSSHVCKKYRHQFACEKHLYKDDELPPTTIGWGPRDYTISRVLLTTANESDSISDEDAADGISGGGTDKRTIPFPACTDKQQTNKELKYTATFNANGAAQCIAQGIDSAEKESRESNAVFPVRVMTILTTGQRYCVFSVTIASLDSRPSVAYHGMKHMRIMPFVRLSSVRTDDPQPSGLKLKAEVKVDRDEIEGVFALLFACMIGLVDLEPRGGQTVDPKSLDHMFDGKV